MDKGEKEGCPGPTLGYTDENLSEVVSVFDSEEFLQLVVNDISAMSDPLTAFVFPTLHITHNHTMIPTV